MTAPGDLLTADWQFQLHETLYGRGNNGVSIENHLSVDGLGVPDAKTQDVDKNFGDGAFANPDYLTVRVITIPVVFKGTPTTAITNFKTFTTFWVPQPADIDLAFQLPGWGKFYVMGRPRGAKADTSLMNRGAVRALLRFDCPDPTIHAVV